MIVCDVFFKEFYARGSDDYLSHWATEVDWMAADGWRVVECCRQSEYPGFWTVVFGRTRRKYSAAQH
jgi:hypothetical protein